VNQYCPLFAELQRRLCEGEAVNWVYRAAVIRKVQGLA